MSFLTEGLPLAALLTGNETFNVDTNLASGGNPQSVSLEMYKLALMLTTMLSTLNKTMVAGTVYYGRVNIGVSYDPRPQGADISEQSFAVTGVNIPVGTTGGTDTWHVYVFNTAGTLVARSETAGVTAGTANTIQQIPLFQPNGTTAGPINLTSGGYFIGLQSSGTTAVFRSVNSPIWPMPTGQQAGVAGTFPAITPATTYTADRAPLASFY